MRIGAPMALALVLLLPVSAFAAGTVRIVQSDGSAQTYVGAAIKLQDHTLLITSPDGVSTITVAVNGADCWTANGIISCAKGRMSFRRNGKDYAIPFKAAKFYLNSTDQEQPAGALAGVLASVGCQVVSKVAPHTIVFAVLTKAGTYITGNGTYN